MNFNKTNKPLIVSVITVFSISIITIFSCGAKKYKIYNYSNGTTKDSGKTIALKFYSIPNLPYVNVKDYLDTFVGNVYDITYLNNVFTFTNKIWKAKSSSYKPCATFNANTNTITYDDYACFICINEYAANPVDLVSGYDPDLEISGYKLFGDGLESEHIAGNSVSINIKDTYNIQTYVENNNLYMPIYTAKSLFTSNHISSYFYNGEALYESSPNDNDSYSQKIKKNLFTPSSAYLEYSYNQFALDLDLHFGMGGISRKMRYNNMNEFEYKSGLGGKSYEILNSYKNEFLSSASGFDSASEKVFANLLDDGGHTGILSKSYYSSIGTIKRGKELEYSSESLSKIVNQRYDKEEYPYGTSYCAINSKMDTAILRLENFDYDGLINFITICNVINTSEEYPNIKNLIIDMSCNGGGYVFFQHYMNQYLSRGASRNYFVNSINGSKGYVKYPANVYLDNVIDEKDKLPSLTGENKFTVEIICSNFTFSAANATTCYAKTYAPSDTNFHLLGENSGGGVCAVDSTMMNPLGLTAQFSSPYRITYSDYVTNVDDGVDKDETSFYKQWNSHTNSGAKEYSKYYLGV